MSQDAGFYRTGLIESIILLLLLLLAFGALTVMMRERWLALGATESLLAANDSKLPPVLLEARPARASHTRPM